MNIILASKSPRRIELLKNIVDSFEIMPANIDEDDITSPNIENIPQLLAVNKARHIADSHSNALVIGCDTGVFIDGKMLGKPKSEVEAFEMLATLSGRTHKVITGCAIIFNGEIIEFSEETDVTFTLLDEDNIRKYISYGECMDKAGAYGIQGKGSMLVEKINGDFYNVMGLPVCRLAKEMRKFLDV